MTRAYIHTLLVGIVSGLCLPAAAAQHPMDYWVGRTADDTITMGGFFDPIRPGISVLPEVSGLLNGWSENDPGFDHVQTPQPKLDLFPLDAGAEIWIEVVEMTPAFRAIDASFQILNLPGDVAFLGDHLIHEHLTWHIDSTDDAFDELRTLWTARLKLVDVGSTEYAEMEFVSLFRNVECTTADINGDGTIDDADDELFAPVLADPGDATAEQRCAADCNLDGLVTKADIPVCEELFHDSHGHGDDLIVGRTTNEQLAVEFDFDDIVVLPTIDGVIEGWALDDPGFGSLEDDEPDEGFFVLDTEASVVLELVEVDPALKLWSPGFGNVLDETGDRWTIGGPDFDEHPTWHIDSADPQFDALRTLWRIRFSLLDEGATAYEPTETLTVMLSNVECEIGDINDDHQVNAADSCMFYEVLADPGAANAVQRCAADANLDGLVTSDDEAPFLALISELHILNSSPSDGAIDARQTSDINGGDEQGWAELTLTLGIGAEVVELEDFSVEHSGAGPAPIVVDIIAFFDDAVTIALDRPISAGAWTRVSHEPSCTSVRIGYLPADVNGDGTSSPLDILALIDHLNGLGDQSEWSTDINRSGLTEPSDILRVIDLLNGAGEFEAWNGVTLP